MSNLPFFIFEEHSKQREVDEKRLSILLSNGLKDIGLSSKNMQYLGLNEEFESNYFIGMRWIGWQENELEQKGVIWVQPKHAKIPYEKLLFKCLNHPKVCGHLDQCYEIFPDEPEIPVPKDFDDYITPLLITDFLVRIQKIARKGLKKGFVTVHNTLNNKIKGKILVNQTINHQLKKNNITQTHCSYQIHTEDCTENRILKAALLQSQKYIYRFMQDREQIKDLLNYNLTTFEEVKSVSINLSDFNDINHSAFYKEYKPSLILAKRILKGLGFSLNSDISLKNKTIPPFYINMPELFERYCEVLLRNKYPDTLAGYQYKGFSETRLGKSKLRPDFIIPSENRIVDSKYKYWINGGNDIGGLMQLSLYSRHKKAIELLNSSGKIPTLQFIFPKNDGELEINFETDKNKSVHEYFEIFKYPLSLIDI